MIINFKKCFNINIKTTKSPRKPSHTLIIAIPLTLVTALVVSPEINTYIFGEEEENKIRPTETTPFEFEDIPEDVNAENGTAQDMYLSWYNEGYLFADSSSIYLDDKDIELLYQIGSDHNIHIIDLLQAAINEIYARNGYSFLDNKYRNFYEQTSWYIDQSLTQEETTNYFNSYESYNVDYLAKLRDQLSD